MTQTIEATIAELGGVLTQIGRVAVAVSGGVDSLTLAHVAHRQLGEMATMFHAISPAVPPEATQRTRRHAEQFGWNLDIFDAGEFSDSDYLRNPVNRCFYCKTNLYGAIAKKSRATIVSGTNFDDLADFRPGLKAADNFSVRHPYVEVRIDKARVRAIAHAIELDDIAELAASPCLSSRIETGIKVEAGALGLVHAVEKFVSQTIKAQTVRCRVRSGGLVVELDGPSYEHVTSGTNSNVRTQIEQIVLSRGFPGKIDFARYRMGSAFLRS